MSQENNYETPRRLNEYHYDAAGDCMQAADEENPYENTQFPDDNVAQDFQGTNFPPPQQGNNMKPTRRLSKLQIAIISALILNFALAVCGIVLLMLEKNKMDVANESTRSDFQMQKQMNGEINKKMAQIKAQISGSLHVLENSLHEQERLSNDRENRHNLTHTEILNELRAIELGLRNQSDSVKQKLELLRNMTTSITSIRLAGGSYNYGRVEVLYGGVWGTVCDDSWGLDDAEVVCRMLGFQSASSAPQSAAYGQGSGQIWLDEVQCRGTEGSLWVCPKNQLGTHDCSHSEDASVICT